MPTASKNERILKCFLTIEALKRKNGVTNRELSEILNIPSSFKNNDYRCAQRYIDAASLVLPVIEICKRHSMGARFGPPSTAYGLLQGK